MNSLCPCHNTHIEKTKDIYGKLFKHSAYETKEKVSCSDCHFDTIQGDGNVDNRNCYQCHQKVDDKVTNVFKVSDMHNIHTVKHKTTCTSCHETITHGWDKINDNIVNQEPANASHKVQYLMMMGSGGMGIKVRRTLCI